MARNNFGTLKAAAMQERKRAVDPRHEEPPHGDFPHLDVEPLEDLDRDANHDIHRLVLTAIGITVAIAVAMTIVTRMVTIASISAE
jgi:hypothetical protein